MRLFLERAVAAAPGFRVTERNAAAVAEVCRRLDGIPLAVELAATRLRALSLEELAARLEDRFRLLTQGSRTAQPRQQTLQATLDWSHDLLSEPERIVLRRLSVFAGGWTLAAAEAVCRGPVGSRQSAVGSPVGSGQSAVGSPDGPSLPTAYCPLPTDVLDLLTGLVEKSLVSYSYEEQEGEGRYRLLETVRQYARDRLLESGEAEAVRARHCDFFVAYAERAEPESGVVGEPQVAWLERVETELDNLRAALEWGLASEPEAALRMAGALGPFWELHGYLTEGREFLERGLERAREAPAEVRAKGLGCAGSLAQRQGDWERAKELLEGSLELSRSAGSRRVTARSLSELGMVANSQGNADAAWGFIEQSLAICREIGDPWGTAHALSTLATLALQHRRDPGAARLLCVESLAIQRQLGNRRGIADALRALGWIAMEEGDYHAARSLYEESLAIHRETGDKPGTYWALNGLGWAAESQGDYEAARGFFEERLTIAREMGSRRFVAFSLWRLGDVAWAQGEYEAARERYEESRALGRQMGNQWVVSEVLDGLGNVASAQGEYTEARACFEESLRLRHEAGWKPRTARSLEGLAKIAAVEGDAVRAARLWGAAEGLLAAVDRTWSLAKRADYERSVRAACSQLDAEAFAAAWAEGRAMALEDAVAYALAEPSDA